MKVSKEKEFKTISEIQDITFKASNSENPYKVPELRNNRLLSVVLDASKPQKTKSNDYLQKVKIIDQSWNFSEGNIQGKHYLHVFHFARTLEEMIPFQQLGDVLYLKRFKFKLYGDELQGLKDRLRKSKILLIGKNTDLYSYDEFETRRIQEIQQWSLKYFSQISLLKQSWFGFQKPNSPYDILLKIVKIEVMPSFTSKETLLTLENSEGINYSLVLQDTENETLKENQVLKVRDVQINTENKIVTNEYSCLLILPNYFYDSLYFPNTVQHVERIVEIGEEFQHGKEKQVYLTKIKQKWVEQIKEITQLKDLMEGEQLPKKYYRVVARILDIHPQQLKQAMVYSSVQEKLSFTFGELITSNKQLNETYLPTSFIKLALIDDSIELSDQVFVAIVFSQNSNIDNFFPNLDFSAITLSNVQENEQIYSTQIVRCLESCNKGYSCEFILETFNVENRICFRIVDSILSN